jgi:hypothetical protein
MKKPGTPTEKDNDLSLAEATLARWGKMDGDRQYFLSLWEQVGRYVMPRKSYITSNYYGQYPNITRDEQLFDTTGVRSNLTLAAGCMSYITPADSMWCSITAPEEIQDADDVATYFAECSEIILQELARSNFYSCAHEMYLDRGCFGTAVLYVQEGDVQSLNFTTFDVGSFAVSENHEGLCDVLMRRYQMSVRQIVGQFGIENVSVPTREKFNGNNGKSRDEQQWVIQSIRPRDIGSFDTKKKDPKNKPVESIYMEENTKHILRNGGYDELPFFATRFLKWGTAAYGIGPGITSLPELRQLNFLQKQMDAGAELQAFPRILVPDNMENAVDLRAGGITYFNAADPQSIPREWATAGRYDVGNERIKDKQAIIEDIFSVPLFQMFAQQETGQPPTATQVRAMQAEKMTMFSPAFSRLTTELLIPLLRRVYGILARQGKFPTPPKSLIQKNPKGELYLPEPQIQFNSRIALAVKEIEAQATTEIVMAAGQIVQLTQDPSILDNLDTDKLFRDTALNKGLDPDFLRSEDSIAQMRQARQQQIQNQQQMQIQAHMAQVANQVGGIPQDSHVGQMMTQNSENQ